MFTKQELEQASQTNMPDLWGLNLEVAREVYLMGNWVRLGYSGPRQFARLDQLGNWLEAQDAILAFPREKLLKGLVTDTRPFERMTDYQTLRRGLEITAHDIIGLQRFANLYDPSRITVNWEDAQRELAEKVLTNYRLKLLGAE